MAGDSKGSKSMTGLRRLFKVCYCFLLSTCFRLFNTACLRYVFEYDGLGNRLKGMANYYSHGYRKFLLLWRDDSWVTAPFDDLFVLEGCKIYKSHWRWTHHFFRYFVPDIGLSDFRKYPFWSFLLPHDFKDKQFIRYWNWWGECKENSKVYYSIDWRYNDIPQEIRELYRPFFKALKPSVKVLNRIHSFSNMDIKQFVGVHIRNTNNPEDKKMVCSIQTVFDEMSAYSDDTFFFMCCHTVDVSDAVRKAFPNRIFELPNKDYNSMIDSVADMYLLGQCKFLILSPTSSFSECAWWWSGAKIPVTMLDEEYCQKDMKK